MFVSSSIYLLYKNRLISYLFTSKKLLSFSYAVVVFLEACIFYSQVVDHEMARLYHVRAEVSTATETQEPDINSLSTIIQVEGTSAYMQSTFGE